MKKKIISSILILSLIFPEITVAVNAAEPYHGYIEETDSKKQQEDKIFTKEKAKLDATQNIELTVSQVLNGATSMEGDEFFAEVSTEVLSGSGVLLPKGTVAHGRIKDIIDPKRMGRNGYIELSFDYLITPDGREIPIEGDMSSKLGPAKTTAKVVGESVAATAVGGVYGAVAAIEIAGLEGAIVSHGYTLLGGAAIGGVIALGMCLFRKGENVLISPGDVIKVKIKSTDDIQVMTHEAVRQDEIAYEGLDVKITDIYLEKDPFDHLNTYTLDLIINNNSKTDFSTFDIEMVSDLHSSYRPSIFTDYKNSLAMKRIRRGESVSGVLSFSVDNPKRQHWLVFYDKRTHKPLARISIDNAKKALHISDNELTKKRKKRPKF
jgi:hypothetical protein